MITTLSSRGVLVAALVTGSLATLGQLAPAAADDTPPCVAAHLKLVRGSAEGAAGTHYQHFRITNVGTWTCRLAGYPTFRFRDAAGDPLGFASQPAGQPVTVVRLEPGQHTRITVGTVNPDVTMASDCHAAQAASVAITLPHRPHVYHRALSLRVCTTEQYRPTAFPVGF